MAHQVALQGSAVVPEGQDGDGASTCRSSGRATGAVPTHFIAAFGPQAGELAVARRRRRRPTSTRSAAGSASARPTSPTAELHRRVAELQAENDEFRAELRGNHKEFEDWRRYIHELEGQLGIPAAALGP